MFESLTKGFQGLFAKFAGNKTLTEENVKDALREVRMALLEADVNLGVVRDFLAKVKEKALGAAVTAGVDPGQMIVKIIHDELTALMGPEAAPLVFAGQPTVILMAGLQGSGKTTTCGIPTSAGSSRGPDRPWLCRNRGRRVGLRTVSAGHRRGTRRSWVYVRQRGY